MFFLSTLHLLKAWSDTVSDTHSICSTENQSNDPSSLVDALSKHASTDKLEQFANLDCDLTKVFLYSIMTTSLKKSQKFDPKASLFDDHNIDLFEIDGRAKLEKKLDKLLTTISCLHASQTNSAKGFGRLKLIRGLLLYIDRKGGVSEKMMQELSSAGLSMASGTLRDFVQNIAGKINPNDLRQTPSIEDLIAWLIYTFDNADFRLYAKVVSMIVGGTILGGYETKEENGLMNKEYIKDLPIPDENKDMATVLPSEHDDMVAQEGIDLQNIQALMQAYYHRNQLFMTTKERTCNDDDSEKEYGIGSSVRFDFRNGSQVGTVTMIDGIERVVEYTEANGVGRTTVSASDLLPVLNANGKRRKPNFSYERRDAQSVNEIYQAASTETNVSTDTSVTDIQISPTSSTDSTNETKWSFVGISSTQMDCEYGACELMACTKFKHCGGPCEEIEKVWHYCIGCCKFANAVENIEGLEIPLHALDDEQVKELLDDVEIVNPFVYEITWDFFFPNDTAEMRGVADCIPNFVVGKDDGGDRCKVTAATTVVTDIMTGVSSKHYEATETVYQRYVQSHPNFDGIVHTMITDQEFMPNLYRKLFMSLKSNKRQPLVLGLAMGHVLKCIVASMFTYYKPILDPLFKAQGIKIDSPAHGRILKGRNIRDSMKWMISAIETLRIAHAKLYLDAYGDDEMIDIGEGEDRYSANQLIELLVSSNNFRIAKTMKKQDGGPKICLGADARPQTLPNLKDIGVVLARHFQQWVELRAYGGLKPTLYAGPSGYVYGDEGDDAKKESLESGNNTGILCMFILARLQFISLSKCHSR